jgi:hypothetical protein
MDLYVGFIFLYVAHFAQAHGRQTAVRNSKEPSGRALGVPSRLPVQFSVAFIRQQLIHIPSPVISHNRLKHHNEQQ